MRQLFTSARFRLGRRLLTGRWRHTGVAQAAGGLGPGWRQVENSSDAPTHATCDGDNTWEGHCRQSIGGFGKHQPLCQCQHLLKNHSVTESTKGNNQILDISQYFPCKEVVVFRCNGRTKPEAPLPSVVIHFFARH